MRRRAEVAFVLLGALLVLVGPALSGPSSGPQVVPEEATLELTRYGGVEGHGRFAASCLGVTANLRNGVEGAWRLVEGQAFVAVYRYHVTRFLDEKGQVVREYFEEPEPYDPIEVVVLPAGAALRVADEGHAYTVDGDYRVLVDNDPTAPDGAESNFRLRSTTRTSFESDAWRMEAGFAPASPAYRTNLDTAKSIGHGVTSGEPMGGRMTRLGQVAVGVHGPQMAAMDGEGFVLFDEATIEGDGVHVRLPRFRQVLEEVRLTPTLVSQRAVETYGLIRFEYARAQIQPMDSLYCEVADWSGQGNISFREARGTLTRPAGEPRRIKNQTFDWNGTVTSRTRADFTGEFDPVRAGREPRSELGQARAELAALQTASASANGVAEWTWRTGLGVLTAWVLARLWPVATFLFTRLLPGRALTHPARAAVYAAIAANPGIQLQDVARRFQRSYGFVRHHVRILRAAGHIRWLRRGTTIHLYLARMNVDEARRSLALQHDEALKELMGLLPASGATPAMVVRALRSRLGISRVGCWKVLRRAKGLELLETVPSERGVLLRPREPIKALQETSKAMAPRAI